MMNSERDWESSLLIVKVKQLSGKSSNARLVIWLHHRLFAAYQYLKFIRKRNWSQLASFIIHISRNLKAARENLAELDEIQRILDILNGGSTFKVTPVSIDIFHNHRVQTIVHQGHFHNFQQHILQIQEEAKKFRPVRLNFEVSADIKLEKNTPTRKSDSTFFGASIQIDPKEHQITPQNFCRNLRSMQRVQLPPSSLGSAILIKATIDDETRLKENDTDPNFVNLYQPVMKRGLEALTLLMNMIDLSKLSEKEIKLRMAHLRRAGPGDLIEKRCLDQVLDLL